jgi:hypothetical protein
MGMTRYSRKLIKLAVITLSLIAFSHAKAALVDVERNANIIYAAYAAPNKIVRYNLESETTLEEIRLAYTPNKIAFADNTLMFTSGHSIYRLEANNSQSQILSTSAGQQGSTRPLTAIAITDDYYVVGNSDSRFYIYNRSDASLITTLYIYSASDASIDILDNENVIINSSEQEGCLQLNLNTQASNITTKRCQSAPVPYNSAVSEKRLDTSESTIFVNNGFNYHRDTLELKSSFGKPYDVLTITENEHAIIGRKKELSYLTAFGELKGSYSLSTDSEYLTIYNNTLFSLSSNNYTPQIEKVPLQSLSWSSPDTDNNATNTFTYSKVLSNGSDTLYFIDNESSLVRTWNTTQSEFSNNYPLSGNVTNAFFSDGYLYLAGEDFSISRYDFSSQTPGQEYLGFLPQTVNWISHHDDTKFLAQAGDDYYVLIDSETGWNDYRRSSYEVLRSHKDTNLNHLIMNRSYTFSLQVSSNGLTLTSSSSYEDIDYNNALTELSPNGQLLISTDGKLYQPGNRTSLNSLNTSVSLATWFTDHLVTFNSSNSELSVWDSNYLKLNSRMLANSNSKIFNLDESLVIVEEAIPSQEVEITEISFSSEADIDNDNVIDLIDNCPESANTDQIDTDGDSKGNACDLDDDNDLIPDSFETENGLDPLNANDALLDKDSDGINNRTEYILETDINDSASTPEQLTELSLDFNDGSISPMYRNANGWLTTENGFNSTVGIKSAKISGLDQSSSVFLTHYFSNGLLSFNHNPNNSSSGYRLKVYIDGELKESYYNSSYDDEWKTRRITISEGIQTIEFRIEDNSSYPTGNAQHIIDNIVFDLDQDGDSIPDSVDNCPTVSNSWQRDDNNNGIGDDCEGEYADDDSDGIQNYRDNCPTIANPGQENMDYDGYGNACDPDIDGDGMENAVEDKYDFLDPQDPNDGYLDQDNDGISNRQEIAEGTDPSTYNERERISLLEYFPLGNLEVKLNNGGGYTIKPAGKNGEFIFEVIDSPYYQKYRITDKGLEITEVYLPDEQVTVEFDGLVEIPTSMFLGEVRTFSYSGKVTGEERVTGLEQRIELYAAGQSEWNGKSYDYITLLQDGSMTTYFKGMGPMYSGSLNSSPPEIQEIKINSLADTSVVSSDSSSGGALSYLWLMSFCALIVLARRQSFRYLARS